MSNFQEELRNEDGYENIVIIAVGQTNISSFNNNFCANSDLPLVMDPYPDLPIRQQFAPYGQDHYLVIVDYDGEFIDYIDIPNLGNAQKSYIRNILEEYYGLAIKNQFIAHLKEDYARGIEVPYMKDQIIKMLGK